MSKDSKEYKKILQELLKLPENRECADCTAKGPLWAAVNHGIFLCIRCAGIHRGMGTHISKVRSVTLDSWTAEQIDIMIRTGNKRANEYFQANFPPNKSKPSENASPTIVEQFCRAKYEKKLWTSKLGRQAVEQQQDDDDDVREEKIPPVRKVQPSPQLQSQVRPPAQSITHKTDLFVDIQMSNNNNSISQTQKSSDNDLLSFESNTMTLSNNMLEDLVTSGFSNQPQSQSSQQAAPKQNTQQAAPKQNILSLFDAPQQQPMHPQYRGYPQQLHYGQRPMYQQMYGIPNGYPAVYGPPQQGVTPQYGVPPQQGAHNPQYKF